MKTLITCHANADCDSFAAMLAARRLYAPCDLLFPGTQESGLAKVYAELDKDKYGFVDSREINWEDYNRLVIVDTRQAARLPHVSKLLDKSGITIEIWDHHPPSAEDIATPNPHLFTIGAMTSALCKRLEEKGVILDDEEATLLGLGIYGDTGSFTFSSTTREDFAAASWLLGQGMDTGKINDMASHELTSLHVQALNNLIQSSRAYEINDATVVLAEASMEHYLGDFAYLAHKLMEMEKFTALFAIGIMGDRIQVVARSNSEDINVGDVCARLGGGGHIYAASASVRDKSITEVREIILRSLHEMANPGKCARDYMSSPPIGARTTSTLREADELMLHFGLKAVPVFQPGTHICRGLLDAQTAARATAHGLGNEPVEEYMQRRVLTLGPDATLQELVDIIVGARQRLVPIIENGEVTGVVTRTDMINVFASESARILPIRSAKQKPLYVGKLIEERLPKETQRILRLAGSLGAKLRLPVYAVGGFARDLLLNRPNKDIDLVAEGNGIALARELARELGGRVREHNKFLTSVVIWHDETGVERHIDVATARLEYYEYPAALPTVELSSIKMDLFRRDFSINALAIRLDSKPYGELVDFFGGRRDIKDHLIRVLHTLSFVEDPTRCIRAVRFEQRYKFRIGTGTEKLIKNVLAMSLLDKLSPQRVFNEYRIICDEEDGAACLLRMDEIGILQAIDPNLALNPARKALLPRMRDIIDWYRRLYFEEPAQAWLCYFYVLCRGHKYPVAAEIYRRLGLPPGQKARAMSQREKIRALMPKLLRWQSKDEKGVAKASQFCELLADVSLPALLFCMASTDNAGLEKNISRYITQWSREKADINGDDLRLLGLEPGPEFGVLLKSALVAKLDGKAPTAKSQIAHVLRQLKNARANESIKTCPTRD